MSRSVDVMLSLATDQYDSVQLLSHEMLRASSKRDVPPRIHALSILSAFVQLTEELSTLELDDPTRIDQETIILYVQLLEHVLTLGAKLNLPLDHLLRNKTYRYDSVQADDVPNKPSDQRRNVNRIPDSNLP